MKRSAIYPGSFDPFTLGHRDIALRARDLFGAIVIGIASNPEKKTLFSKTQRKRMIERALCGEGGITIVCFDGLLTAYMKKHGLSVVVRGIRDERDYRYESIMAATNRTLLPAMETVFLATDGRYAHISSTLVREIARGGGDISGFVPKEIVTLVSPARRR